MESLSDVVLDAYIADTQRRIKAMSRASLRKGYEGQLRLAEEVRSQRTPHAEPPKAR